jgi:hypothetical protein
MNNNQSWQPMQGVNFYGNKEGNAMGQEAQEGQTDNKAKAIELAKKGWAMYKDKQNKG